MGSRFREVRRGAECRCGSEPKPQASLSPGLPAPEQSGSRGSVSRALVLLSLLGTHGPRLPLVPQLVSGGACSAPGPLPAGLSSTMDRGGVRLPRVGVGKDQDQEWKTYLLLNVAVWFQDLRVRN